MLEKNKMVIEILLVDLAKTIYRYIDRGSDDNIRFDKINEFHKMIGSVESACKYIINAIPEKQSNHNNDEVDKDRLYGGLASVACFIHENFYNSGDKMTYKLPPLEKETLHMIIHKLARAYCGNCFYLDNYIDIIGYIQAYKLYRLVKITK